MDQTHGHTAKIDLPSLNESSLKRKLDPNHILCPFYRYISIFIWTNDHFYESFTHSRALFFEQRPFWLVDTRKRIHAAYDF